MKIISGDLKNQSIELPVFLKKVDLLRPTEAVVKKSIFASIKRKIKGSFFLDLFAGTGMVGFEAFSNGAKYVGFVEHHRKIYQVLLKNFKKLTTPGVVLWGNSYKRMNYFSKKKIKFDIIFIDPPYFFNQHEENLKKIYECSLIAENGIIIIERFFKEKSICPTVLEGTNLMLYKKKKIRSTVLEYFKFNSL